MKKITRSIEDNSIPEDDSHRAQRRSLLKAMGFGAIAMMGATGMYPIAAGASTSGRHDAALGTDQLAQIDPSQIRRPARPLTGAPTLDPRVVQLKQLDTRQLRQLTVVPRMPPSTPIAQMGLDRRGVSMLTPAARQLTKADLENLGAGRISGKLAELTVEDINSIKGAFGGGYNPGSLAAVSCCCCTPCCCAAAVTDAHPIAA